MKRATAFVGSARKQGVTYRATRAFLDTLQSFGDVEGEIVFLSEHDNSRRFGEALTRPRYPEPTLLQLFGFRMARTAIRMEQPDGRPDPTYYRDHGWFESDYYYPTKLSPLKRAAGAAFDRIAASSSKARAYPRADV